MDDSYLTVSAPATGVYKEKGSKFIALSFPVASEEEIRLRLEEVRKDYHDARHHCFAWALGKDRELYRVNDDGEPSGTAGKPIYGQVLSKDLTNILVVVVRYFGGTKLGVPGLINAYRTATKEALDASRIVGMTVNDRIRVGFDYPLMDQVMRVIREESGKILSQEYDNRCSIELTIRRSSTEKLVEKIRRIPGAIPEVALAG
jgi:uncharacterized YigZ family protein